MAQTEVKAPALVKGLGLLDATTLVMGSMIGSGVFIVAADISRQVQSPGLMMLTWVITAVLTIIAALSYGELSAAMPQAGGQYIYLREAFGPSMASSTAGLSLLSFKPAQSPPSPSLSPSSWASSSPPSPPPTGFSRSDPSA